MKLASNRYRGDDGKEYFQYQSVGGNQRGRVNARKFKKYVQKEDVVLDFGCGNGSLLAHLDCKRKIGVEINPAAHEEARTLDLEIFETLDEVKDNSINLVISNHALEHTLDPYWILSKIYKKLTTGGRLALALPIDDWRTQRVENPSDINHHLYTWTPLLIGNLLSETGYQNIHARVYSHAWPSKTWQFWDQHLPVWGFDAICWFVSWRDNRRQVMAFAEK